MKLQNLFVVGLLGVGAFVFAQNSQSRMIEPNAGTWKTWVIPSGSSLRLPAPDRSQDSAEIAELKAIPRDAQALESVAYWNAGSPSYRWVQIMLEQYDKVPFAPVRNIRTMSMMNVAIYDAIIAAWDSKYAFKRARPSSRDTSLSTVIPNPASPSYPSEQAVVAGAASSILAFIYPKEAQRFNDLAEEAGRSRLVAGVNFPSDVKAGLELGRKVAAMVIERAKTDNSDAKWTPPAPASGVWSDTRPALEPMAGTWKPWVLTRNDQFRSVPPPAFGSQQLASELEAVKKVELTQPKVAKAYYYASNEGTYNLWYNFFAQKLFEYNMNDNIPRVARAYALLSVADMDSLIACWETKFFYMQVRPWQIDPSIATIFKPVHPSYPSGHACGSSALAEITAYYFPKDAALIRAKAVEAADSRITAGIHFESDKIAGLKLGQDVAAAVIERAKADGSQ
jgi:membrane-associated phospholipid phosphatase